MLDCGGVLREHRDSWSHLIPTEPEERAILAEHYFNTVCSLMARQLRDCVKASIDEFISFLKIYQVIYKTTCNYSNFWVTYMHCTCTVFVQILPVFELACHTQVQYMHVYVVEK